MNHWQIIALAYALTFAALALELALLSRRRRSALRQAQAWRIPTKLPFHAVGLQARVRVRGAGAGAGPGSLSDGVDSAGSGNGSGDARGRAGAGVAP
jgi:hypothetical protein